MLNVVMAGTYGGVDWDDYKDRFMSEVIDHLDATLLPGLTDHVQLADVATPFDFERRIGLGQGSLHGITQDITHTTVFRPSNKSKCIDGLYLAGSSTNPGGGVPTVIASGFITAKLVERFESWELDEDTGLEINAGRCRADTSASMVVHAGRGSGPLPGERDPPGAPPNG